VYFIGKVDRSMLATGAANRDGHIAAITLIEVSHNTADKCAQSFTKGRASLIAVQVLLHQRILTGQVA
jgi:hypothetical protein